MPNSLSSVASTVVPTFWRVEGSLLELGALRPVGYFTWNAQSFAERWARRAGMIAMTLVRPFAYAGNRVFATRLLHTLLRGVSRDRLDLLGEEYFEYVLKSRLRRTAVDELKGCLSGGESIVLVSQGLDHVIKPLATYLGVKWLIANRLEFRDGYATGRLIEPVIRPRGPLAWLMSGSPQGWRVPRERLVRALGLARLPGALDAATQQASRPAAAVDKPVVRFSGAPVAGRLSVRETLAGKHILLVGFTGFIGKVWLVHLLSEVPEIGNVTLLIRSSRTTGAERRFRKIVEESPAFEPLHQRYGCGLGAFLRQRVEVVEGDVSQPGLGLEARQRERLEETLDLVVNCAGLTDFNPDLRDALACNADSVLHLVEFLRQCRHAGLVHLSTCFVAGARDGYFTEELVENHNPKGEPAFDARREMESLRRLVRQVEERGESPELAAALRRQALGRRGETAHVSGEELAGVLRRNRARWVRNRLTRAGLRRAQRLGWPNTYTFTKSLGESLLAAHGAGLPAAIVRPSIVESSTRAPFGGWNEGVNTSGPLSYLLGTKFRQLPTTERKCLDIVPVDMVSRGMMLIAAAVIARRHARVYQLATSAVNPCDMARSIELTGLAHRKHYRAQQGLERWLKLKLETIPVSKQRYERLSVPMQKALVSGINRFAESLRMKKGPLARQERELSRTEKLIELYEPFILHNQQVFEAENARLLSAALPPEERTAFAFDPENLDWWEYWINIHVPALRRWCYPLMEGKPLEARPARELDWGGAAGEAASQLSGAGPRQGGETAPGDSLWPSS